MPADMATQIVYIKDSPTQPLNLEYQLLTARLDRDSNLSSCQYSSPDSTVVNSPSAVIQCRPHTVNTLHFVTSTVELAAATDTTFCTRTTATMSMISTIHGEERSISGDGPDAFEDGPVMPPKTSQDKRGTKVRDLIKKQLHLEKSARNQVWPQSHDMIFSEQGNRRS